MYFQGAGPEGGPCLKAVSRSRSSIGSSPPQAEASANSSRAGKHTPHTLQPRAGSRGSRSPSVVEISLGLGRGAGSMPGVEQASGHVTQLDNDAPRQPR